MYWKIGVISGIIPIKPKSGVFARERTPIETSIYEAKLAKCWWLMAKITYCHPQKQYQSIPDSINWQKGIYRITVFAFKVSFHSFYGKSPKCAIAPRPHSYDVQINYKI